MTNSCPMDMVKTCLRGFWLVLFRYVLLQVSGKVKIVLFPAGYVKCDVCGYSAVTKHILYCIEWINVHDFSDPFHIECFK